MMPENYGDYSILCLVNNEEVIVKKVETCIMKSDYPKSENKKTDRFRMKFVRECCVSFHNCSKVVKS